MVQVYETFFAKYQTSLLTHRAICDIEKVLKIHAVLGGGGGFGTLPCQLTKYVPLACQVHEWLLASANSPGLRGQLPCPHAIFALEN